MEKNHYQKRIYETKTKIDLRIVISQLLSLSTTEPNFLQRKKQNLQKKTSLIQILVESFEKFSRRKALKEKPFSCRNLVPVIHKKKN
jgi:hypothetical protein